MSVRLPIGGQMQAEVLVDGTWHPAGMGDCRCRWQCWMVSVHRSGDAPRAGAGWHDSSHVRADTTLGFEEAARSTTARCG